MHSAVLAILTIVPHQIKYSTVRKVLILGVDGNESLRTISTINAL